MTFPFACPIDNLPLSLAGSAYRCENGHTYDRSKAGYVNLLPVQYKPSAEPGDSKAMVAARRNVMSSGFFKPLAVSVCELVCQLKQEQTGPYHIVDAGCGEGYYTNQIHLTLNEADSPESSVDTSSVLGVDISKVCILAASKAYRKTHWAVANNKRIPVLPGSVSLITSLFGFECWEQWAQMQTKNQAVLVVKSGPQHLIELRRLIYDTVELSTPDLFADALDAGYRISREQTVTITQTVSENIPLALLEMTPHIHRISRTKLETIDLCKPMQMTLDTTVTVFLRD